MHRAQEPLRARHASPGNTIGHGTPCPYKRQKTARNLLVHEPPGSSRPFVPFVDNSLAFSFISLAKKKYFPPKLTSILIRGSVKH